VETTHSLKWGNIPFEKGGWSEACLKPLEVAKGEVAEGDLQAAACD